MSDSDKRDLLIISICIVVILSGSSVYLNASAACAKMSAPTAEFGCLEFWTNRYQSTLAAVVAAVVAFIVVRPALKQAKLTEMQLAASFKPIAQERLEEVVKELKFLAHWRGIFAAARRDLPVPALGPDTMILAQFEIDASRAQTLVDGRLVPLRESVQRSVIEFRRSLASVERDDRDGTWQRLESAFDQLLEPLNNLERVRRHALDKAVAKALAIHE